MPESLRKINRDWLLDTTMAVDSQQGLLIGLRHGRGRHPWGWQSTMLPCWKAECVLGEDHWKTECASSFACSPRLMVEGTEGGHRFDATDVEASLKQVIDQRARQV